MRFLLAVKCFQRPSFPGSLIKLLGSIYSRSTHSSRVELFPSLFIFSISPQNRRKLCSLRMLCLWGWGACLPVLVPWDVRGHQRPAYWTQFFSSLLWQSFSLVFPPCYVLQARQSPASVSHLTGQLLGLQMCTTVSIFVPGHQAYPASAFTYQASLAFPNPLFIICIK